jgi:hypothetical protein
MSRSRDLSVHTQMGYMNHLYWVTWRVSLDKQSSKLSKYSCTRFVQVTVSGGDFSHSDHLVGLGMEVWELVPLRPLGLKNLSYKTGLKPLGVTYYWVIPFG